MGSNSKYRKLSVTQLDVIDLKNAIWNGAVPLMWPECSAYVQTMCCLPNRAILASNFKFLEKVWLVSKTVIRLARPVCTNPTFKIQSNWPIRRNEGHYGLGIKLWFGWQWPQECSSVYVHMWEQPFLNQRGAIPFLEGRHSQSMTFTVNFNRVVWKVGAGI